MTMEEKLHKLFEKGYTTLEISTGKSLYCLLQHWSGKCLSAKGVSVTVAVDTFYKEIYGE